MKKTYSAPVLEQLEAQTVQMMAESLPINSEKTLDGNEALTKERQAWDIWE